MDAKADVAELNRYCVLCRREYGPHFEKCCTTNSLVAMKTEGLFRRRTRYFTPDGSELDEPGLAAHRALAGIALQAAAGDGSPQPTESRTRAGGTQLTASGSHRETPMTAGWIGPVSTAHRDEADAAEYGTQSDRKSSSVHETQGACQGTSRQAVKTDWIDVVFDSSILGVLLGVVVFLHSLAGTGATIGARLLGLITAILAMTMFPSWKGFGWIVRVVFLGAVGALVNGILKAVFN